MNQKIIITGLFFIFVFLFGFWLNRSGKPYNALIFNFHKLIGLSLGIFLLVTVYRVHKVESFSPVQIMAIVGTILIFVSLVIAGGLLSVEAQGGLSKASQSMLAAFAAIHKIFPYLAVLSTFATLYLLLFQKT